MIRSPAARSPPAAAESEQFALTPARPMPEREGRGAKAKAAAKPKAKKAKEPKTSIEEEFDALDAALGASSAGSSGGESESESASDASEDRQASTRERREVRDARQVTSRAAQLARLPGPLVAAMQYKVKRDWPYRGTPCSERTAPNWLTQMTANGRLRQASILWRQAIGATQHKQLAVHTTICEALDQMIIYDGIDVVNSAGCEALIRHALGLELAFEEVQCEADWREPGVVDWNELDAYDVVRAVSRGANVAPRAQEEVRRTRERRAKTDRARAQEEVRRARRQR